MSTPDPKTSPNFLHLPPELSDPDRSRFAVIPVPYDETSSWMKGADKGPEAIIEASSVVEWFDIQTGLEACRHGISTQPPVEFTGDPKKLAQAVATRVRETFEAGQTPVLFGGEHSISIGAIQATAAEFNNLTVLQIDAHGDTREKYHGSRYNHACVMARALEVADIVQVGIRSIDASEVGRTDQSRIFYAYEILNAGLDETWIDQAIDLCTENVYVTIDLDAFDPSVLPATGTPEPGGLNWNHIDRLLVRVAARRNVVAFDVVELLPMPGHHASAFTAAKLVYRFMGLLISNETSPGPPLSMCRR